MNRPLAVIATCAVIWATVVNAESPPVAHFTVPGARFTDALSAQDLAIEALLNTAPDGIKTTAKKGDAKDKAAGTVFGSIRNNAGSNVCGLVLANGSFMFSCAPTGSYSIDTITDSQGLVTLFGFADGHFPYKQVLNGFGRWDVTLSVASGGSTPVTPPPQSTITFTITDGCNNGVFIDYKFYDETNNLVWPSATSHYSTTAFNGVYSNNLSCNNDAKVCYGARSVNFYWGVDVDNSKSCSDCCIFCTQGNSLSKRLVC